MDTRCTASSLSMMFCASRSSTEKGTSAPLYSEPMISNTLVQWRSRMAGLASSSMSGSLSLKASMASLRRYTTWSSLLAFDILYADLV